MTGLSPERRRAYVDEVAAIGALRSSALLRALEAVPREAFLPSGPWLIEAVDGSYHRTPDSDPSRILHSVRVVIDAKRGSLTGNPARIARLIETADLLPGETVLHVGAGLGYASALMAELVGPKGRVIAAEADPELRERARGFLAPWPWVEVVDDALALEPPALDLVFSDTGIAAFPANWIDLLKEGGRMLLPLGRPGDGGPVFLFTSTEMPGWLSARVLALADPKLAEIRWLTTDPHPLNEHCWRHGEGWCITTTDPQR